MRLVEEVKVLHAILPGKNQYGKHYYVYVLKVLDSGQTLIWSTTSETNKLSIGETDLISFDSDINVDGEINDVIQKVSIIQKI